MTWEEHRSAAEEFALIELWEQAAAHYVNAAALLMQSKRLEDTPEITYLQLRAGQARQPGFPIRSRFQTRSELQRQPLRRTAQ